MKHKPHKSLSRSTQLMGVMFALGMLTLSAEMIAMNMGSAFEASVYGPAKESMHKAASTEKKAKETVAPRTFTACERAATRVKNLRRRAQIQTLCHAKEKNR